MDLLDLFPYLRIHGADDLPQSLLYALPVGGDHLGEVHCFKEEIEPELGDVHVL